jgi:MFS family permease
MYRGPTYILPSVFRGIEAWRLSFYIYFLLVNMGFGMYLTISRDMVQRTMGLNYGFMTMLVAAENIPSFIAVFSGGMGDVIGRRKMVLLGSASMLPLMMMVYLPVAWLPSMAAAYVFLWSLAQPSVTGALLHATSSSGFQYSIYAAFGTIGWGVGGPLAGIIVGRYGWSAAWLTASLITLTAFLIAYVFFPRHAVGGEAHARDLVAASRIVAPVFLSATLALSGFLLFYGNYSIVLRSRISDPGLYGVVYTLIPSLVGVTVRPLIGLLSERIEAWLLALTGLLMYTVITLGLYLSSGIIMIILWAIPVYPFMDQGYVLTFSRLLKGSLQAFASGLWGTALSIGGIIVLIVGFTPLTGSLSTILATAEALIMSAALILAWWRVSRARLSRRPYP